MLDDGNSDLMALHSGVPVSDDLFHLDREDKYYNETCYSYPQNRDDLLRLSGLSARSSDLSENYREIFTFV